ncbi:MAG: hypothetical protein OSB44_13180 [Verrucomicrobiales bacterium]|nr:hypothetical protein [Verrucomicrobiales bacterium]
MMSGPCLWTDDKEILAGHYRVPGSFHCGPPGRNDEVILEP